MKSMTSRERIIRMIEHKEADRVPILESPWPTTVDRWRKEGMGNEEPEDYFGLDKTAMVAVDNSPQYPEEVLEETDEYRIARTSWGMIRKNWKQKASTPLVIDSTIKSPDDWRQAKEKMTYDENRIPWDTLKQNWQTWKEEGRFIQVLGWFGFDVTHAQIVGTEKVLLSLGEDPEWMMDMWQTEMDLNLWLLDRIWDEGYHFDALWWPDDMGYKLSQFFSVSMYRELLKPIHKQAIDWAHNKGFKARLHSCGDIRPFIPDLVELGLDSLNPLEVKAGVDPLAVKREFGDQLSLHGGFDALLWKDCDKMAETIQNNLPILKENGGYVFATDHSTPDEVSLDDFQRIVDLVKELGQY